MAISEGVEVFVVSFIWGEQKKRSKRNTLWDLAWATLSPDDSVACDIVACKTSFSKARCTSGSVLAALPWGWAAVRGGSVTRAPHEVVVDETAASWVRPTLRPTKPILRDSPQLHASTFSPGTESLHTPGWLPTGKKWRFNISPKRKQCRSLWAVREAVPRSPASLRRHLYFQHMAAEPLSLVREGQPRSCVPQATTRKPAAHSAALCPPTSLTNCKAQATSSKISVGPD